MRPEPAGVFRGRCVQSKPDLGVVATRSVAQDTSTFYSRKAVVWIQADSCPDYMLKSEECLKNEKERVKHYLHPSSEPKLLQEAERELLATHETVRVSRIHICAHTQPVLSLTSHIHHGRKPLRSRDRSSAKVSCARFLGTETMVLKRFRSPLAVSTAPHRP